MIFDRPAVRICLLFGVLALVLTMLASCGAEIPEPEQGYLCDSAGVLSSAAVSHIVSYDRSLASQCGTHIAILTVTSTDGTAIADYAQKVFRSWKLDSRAVLLVLASEDEDYWALPGEDAAISSGTLSSMLTTYLEPHFAARDYDGGTRALFDALISHYEAYHTIHVDGSDHAGNAFSGEEFDFSLIGGAAAGLGSLISGIVRIALRLAGIVLRIAGGVFGWGVRVLGGVVGWVLSLSSVGIVIVVLIIVAIVRSASGRRH